MSRPLPVAEGPAGTFWTALRDHRFLLPHDAERDVFTHPLVVLADARVEWRPAPQTGTLVSYSWVHLPSEGYEEVPYVLATVRIDRGPQLMCNLVDVAPEDVVIGARVRLVLEERDDGWVVPQFTTAR